MRYKKSISAPEYDIGTIYTIDCSSNVCIVGSAFHQESGCEFELDLSTLKYSVPVCRSVGLEESYTPEKI